MFNVKQLFLIGHENYQDLGFVCISIIIINYIVYMCISMSFMYDLYEDANVNVASNFQILS